MKKLLAGLLVSSSLSGAYLYEIIEFGYRPTKKDLRQLKFKMAFSSLMQKIVTNLYGKQYYLACDRLSYIMLNEKLRSIFA